MSYLTKIAFDLSTDIVGRNDENMAVLYKTQDNPDTNNDEKVYPTWALNLCTKWETYKNKIDTSDWDNLSDSEKYIANKMKSVGFGELKFKDFNVPMIDQFLTVQINNDPDDAGDLSLEETTLLSDIKAWVMERRANDINSAWLWDQEEDYDKYMRDVGHDIKIADYAFDKAFSFAYFFIDKMIERKGKRSSDLVKEAKNEIKAAHFVFNEDAKVKIHYIKDLGKEDWNKLTDVNDIESRKYSEFLVSYDNGKKGNDNISVEYKGYAPQGQRRFEMEAGLIAEVEKLEGGFVDFMKDSATDFFKSNPWPVVSDLMNNIKDLDFERRENNKAREDAKKEKTMRGFNRAADCTGMVATVQKSALAYTKAGYSLTADGIKKFEPINE